MARIIENCDYKRRALDDVFTNNVHETIFCGYYSEIKRKDGIYNAHYPECSDENCPLKHPELLEKWK